MFDPKCDLAATVAYLNDPEDRTAVWQTFCFLEGRGFDVGLMRDRLHGYLTKDGREELTAQQERDIVVALRERAREELGLEKLTQDELQSWSYAPPPLPPPRGRYQSRAASPLYEPTPQEFAVLEDAIESDEPKLLEAIKVLAQENKERNGDGRALLPKSWIHSRVSWYARNLMPEMGGVDREDLVHLFTFKVAET